MTTCKTAALAAALSVVAISCAVVEVRAGGEKVMLPEALGTLYTTVDRADNKQYRELYASPPR